VRNLLIKIAFALTRFIGRQHWPFIHKRITAADCLKIADLAEPGDVLLSQNEGELSNIFIPGFWKHAAVYTGKYEVTEAIGKGVSRCHLIDFAMKKDFVSLWRPLFASKEQRKNAAEAAKLEIGRPYDYEFQSGNKAFYCSELVYSAYDVAMGGKSPFEMRPRYGIMTVTPMDIARADKKFARIA